MIIYPDTSFLCVMYREQSNSHLADAYNEARESPITVSTLLLLEFRQSVRFQIRLFSNDRSKGYPKAIGEKMLHALQSDLSDGIFSMRHPDWIDVHHIAEILSAKHTKSRGHRFADILHVATALHFGAKEFLTFDENQKHLAQAEGLTLVL